MRESSIKLPFSRRRGSPSSPFNRENTAHVVLNAIKRLDSSAQVKEFLIHHACFHSKTRSTAQRVLWIGLPRCGRAKRRRARRLNLLQDMSPNDASGSISADDSDILTTDANETHIRDSGLLDAQVDLGTIPDIDSGQPNSDFGPSPQLDGGPSSNGDAGAMMPVPDACPPAELDCEGILPHNPNAASRYPIVFIHGMGGFENLGPLDYYYGIPALLRENGYGAHVTVTDPFNTSEVRTDQLRPQIDRILGCTCRPKLNLIAHSQGGIDARLLISRDGYGDRVASLTTISTPHRGTRVADALLGLTDGPVDGLLDGFVSAFTGVVWGPPQEIQTSGPPWNHVLDSDGKV